MKTVEEKPDNDLLVMVAKMMPYDGKTIYHAVEHYGHRQNFMGYKLESYRKRKEIKRIGGELTAIWESGYCVVQVVNHESVPQYKSPGQKFNIEVPFEGNDPQPLGLKQIMGMWCDDKVFYEISNAIREENERKRELQR